MNLLGNSFFKKVEKSKVSFLVGEYYLLGIFGEGN